MKKGLLRGTRAHEKDKFTFHHTAVPARPRTRPHSGSCRALPTPTDHRSGLHFAATAGSAKIAELFVLRGADVHMRDR